MIKETDFRVGRRLKTSKGLFDISNVVFGGGKPFGHVCKVVLKSVAKGISYPFKIDYIMNRDFDWIL